MANAMPEERTRLAAIERAYDGTTMHYLGRLGARAGAKVLLVGAGGGSFVDWLSTVVGPTGSVLATDIDPRFLWDYAARFANVTVWRHDAVTEDFPPETFDIAHARLVLIHLPERDRVLDKMIAALKPGGRLLIEDYDWASYGPAYPAPEEDAAIAAAIAFLGRTGFEPYLGRRLPSMLRDRGLLDVDAVGRVITLRGAESSLGTLYRQTFESLGPQLVDTDLLGFQEVRATFARLDDPGYDMLSQTMMSVWGRRPPMGYGTDPRPPAGPPEPG